MAAVAAVLLGVTLPGAQGSSAVAGVIEFTDALEWETAVGAFTTIDFTGFPDGTFVTDQYADLGVLFTGGTENILVSDALFPEDGAGLTAFGVIELTFETPQSWIAVDYLGDVQFELYSSGELIYTSSEFGVIISDFAGLLSTTPFDMVVILDPVDPVPTIDNLHFGVPAPASVGLLALAGLFLPCRRRLERAHCF